MDKLTSKTAIITGGAGGIGQATASLFLSEGANELLDDRDERALREACERRGPKCAFAAADVADQEGTRRYVKAAVDKFGGVDILFANAGVEGPCVSVRDLSVEDFDRVQAVNVRGVFLGIREVAPHMAKRGGG